MMMDAVAMVMRALAGITMLYIMVRGTNAEPGKWSFTKSCGETLGKTAKSGVLYLEPAADLPTNINECSVDIESERFDIQRSTRLMFTFVRFQLSDSCSDTGVRMREVDPVSRVETSVTGLPSGEFCGNTWARKQFTATHNIIRITFRWSDAARRANNTYMELHFASFVITAPCREIDEMVTDPCNSSRCITSDARCLQGVVPCKPVDSDECQVVADDDEEYSIWRNFPTQTVIWVSVGVSVVLAFGCIGISLCCRYAVARRASQNKPQQPVQYAPYGTAANSPYMTGPAGTQGNDSTNQPSVTFGAGTYDTQYSSAFANAPSTKPY